MLDDAQLLVRPSHTRTHEPLPHDLESSYVSHKLQHTNRSSFELAASHGAEVHVKRLQLNCPNHTLLYEKKFYASLL
jgi:hypothetical protein